MTLVLNRPESSLHRVRLDLISGLAPLLAIRDLLTGSAPELKFKWPNDLYEPNQLQKVCGVLTVEKQDKELFKRLTTAGFNLPQDKVLVGIGINLGIEVERQEGLRGHPTSIQKLTQSSQNPDGILLPREDVVAQTLFRLATLCKLAETSHKRFYEVVNDNIWTGPQSQVMLVLKENEETCRVTLQQIDENGVSYLLNNKPYLSPLQEIKRLYPPGTLEI